MIEFGVAIKALECCLKPGSPNCKECPFNNVCYHDGFCDTAMFCILSLLKDCEKLEEGHLKRIRLEEIRDGIIRGDEGRNIDLFLNTLNAEALRFSISDPRLSCVLMRAQLEIERREKDGEWVESNPKESGECRLIKCSKCGCTHIVGSNIPYSEWTDVWKYCHKCGARLRAKSTKREAYADLMNIIINSKDYNEEDKEALKRLVMGAYDQFARGSENDDKEEQDGD